MKLEGDDKLLRIFKEMPDIFTQRKLLAVHKRAAQPLVYRMHRLAPVGLTGNLADSIGIETPSRGDLGEIRVGARRKGGFKGFAGHLIEFGTRLRMTKKGAIRGKLKPAPFVEPAFEQTIGQVEQNIVKEEAAEVKKFLKRLT